LTIWYLAALIFLLALTATGLLYALSHIAERKFDAALWMVAAAEAENAAANVNQRGIERPDDLTVSNTHYREVLGYDNGPLEKYVTIIDDMRRVADKTDNLTKPLPVDDNLLSRALAGETVYQTVKVDNVGWLRVIYMPVRGSVVRHPFVVMVGLPESFVVSEVRSFDITVIMALVTLVLFSGASAMWLADRAISPIEKIAAAAESVNALNLNTRLPEPHARDQIGRLVAIFNQMLERLDAAFKAQRYFTSRAAHELRTPLTILKGEAQVALRRKRSVGEYEDLLKSSLEEIDKLVQIIDDLLLLARYEGGDRELPHERVALHEIVQSVADQLRPLASRKGIDLAVEAEEIFVEGDVHALERLVCKLMENALFYTPRGGRVSARLMHQDGRASLIVEDTGIGIVPDDLAHIFDRFYRSSRAREMRPEGSGIGLSMAATIARLHSATINVTSEKGAGARFVVSFPRSFNQAHG
ncbi:MAG TPA: ATP-binding protein, partial [Pyrinomonadaceae bacterium]|nr:ATP-binding protein [Pyrinomonadaceae bacterium]